MKKLLSILLTLAMLAGFGAVGASASILPDFEPPESPPVLQDMSLGDDEIYDIFMAELFKALFSPGIIAIYTMLDDQITFAGALQPGKAFSDVADAAMSVIGVPDLDLETLLNLIADAAIEYLTVTLTGAEVEDHYIAGTLADELADVCAAAYDAVGLKAALEGLLIADAIDFFYGPFAAYLELNAVLEIACMEKDVDEDLQELYDRINGLIDEVLSPEDLDALILEDDWEGAGALIEAALPYIRLLLAQAGLLAFPPSVAVTYDANAGADTVNGMPVDQTKYEGVELTLSTAVPTRDGYVFTGWATSETGAVAYDPGDTYSADLALELFAIWDEIVPPVTYAVTYDANAGTDTVTGMPAAQTKIEDITLALSTAVPVRAGYTFKGWAISETGAVVYNGGEDYTDNAPLALFAIWDVVVAPVTYAVTYNANAGTDTVTGIPAAQTKYEGVTLALSAAVPVRAGYTFKGWATSATSTVVAYAPGANYTANAAITLYAVWEANAAPALKYFWSNWPCWLQWILKYILFGWLWMRWVKPC